MAVPKTGKFEMFGTGSAFSIEGAISSSVITYSDTDTFSGSAHLVGQSIDTKFDLNEVPGKALLNNINISESLQFRGYPIVDNFNMTLKCVYTSSFTISGKIPPPPLGETHMCLERISGTSFSYIVYKDGWVSSNSNLTGSGGFGDTSWPISSSYDYNELSHKFDTITLRIDTNGLSQTPPTFTSLTISSPGKTDLVLNYCDLTHSSSLGDIHSYFWNSLDPYTHFQEGNCITASYNSTAVDYYIDCDPAITTTPVTITVGNVAISKQQSCDALTRQTVYMTPTDLTNGLTVGDYVYETSDGRNPFNGESKFWGINTSSAPNSNTVPDKIVQIVSNGLITAISDCVPTPPYEPPLNNTAADCNISNFGVFSNTGIMYYTDADYNAGEYDVVQISENSETTQSFHWVSYIRPNKFTLYDDSSTFADPIYSTGWKGGTNLTSIRGTGIPFSNSSGKDQWSDLLNTDPSGSVQIKWGSTTGRKVRVDYGRWDTYWQPVFSDDAVFSLVCSSSLQPLNVATGSTLEEACGGNYDGDVHYHFHTTGSGDFNTLISPGIPSLYGAHQTTRGRVFEDNDGLNTVKRDLSKWISYSSSEGTKYRYMVIDEYNNSMGSIAYHQPCSGTEIAGIYLGESGEDCNDNLPTLASNLVYVKSSWSGFVEQTNFASASYGDFVVDNVNFGTGDVITLEIYDNNHSGTNIDPKSRTNLSNDITNADNSTTTYLVDPTSLLDQSIGANKILATVEYDAARTPTTTIKFESCDGYGSCTPFDASYGFTDSDFSGDDPVVGGMCTNNLYSGYFYIDMSGALEPEAGLNVYSNLGCSSGINDPDAYYNIYNNIIGGYIIKLDGTGNQIAQVWDCPSVTSGSNTYYLSVEFNDYGYNCGQDYAVNVEVSSDATLISSGLYNIVYQSGGRFNGNNKYYIVKTSSTTASGDAGETHRFWQIDSNGIVQDVALQTCDII